MSDLYTCKLCSEETEWPLDHVCGEWGGQEIAEDLIEQDSPLGWRCASCDAYVAAGEPPCCTYPRLIPVVEEIMQAEAEMELVMDLPYTAGVRCTFHKAAPAVKAIPGGVNLCIACCEETSRALIAGIRPDVVTEQARQEWEGGQ